MNYLLKAPLFVKQIKKNHAYNFFSVTLCKKGILNQGVTEVYMDMVGREEQSEEEVSLKLRQGPARMLMRS